MIGDCHHLQSGSPSFFGAVTATSTGSTTGCIPFLLSPLKTKQKKTACIAVAVFESNPAPYGNMLWWKKERKPANMQMHANEAECNFASVCGAAAGLEHVCQHASCFQTTNFPRPSVADAPSDCFNLTPEQRRSPLFF